MKFYSEILDKMFDSEAACVKAECDAKKKENDRIKFEQEKAAAKKDLEEGLEMLTKKTIEYFNKYETNLAPFAETLLSSAGQKERRVERKVMSETDFINLLESFLK